MTRHEDIARWRGFKDLLKDAVVQGAHAIERVHLQTAARPFTVLEQIPPIAKGATAVHAGYDLAVSASYATVRATTLGVAALAELALGLLDDESP